MTAALTRCTHMFADRVVGHHQLVDAGPAAEAASGGRPGSRCPCHSVHRRRCRRRGKSSGSSSMLRRRTRTLQSGQIVRTSRWAITPSTVLATRNGSTPMSIKRVKALGASLVCSVLNTRWPVSDAWMAHLGRFQVADFADQDHVRVVTQDAAQRRRRTSGRSWRAPESG